MDKFMMFLAFIAFLFYILGFCMSYVYESLLPAVISTAIAGIVLFFAFDPKVKKEE